MQPSPGAPLEETEAHIGGHPGQGRQGNSGDHARAEADQDEQKHGVQEVREPRRAPTADIGQAAGGDADEIGAAEDAGAEVGDPVSTELSVGVGRARGRCRPWKCSTTRDVIRMLTEVTKAKPSADGKTSVMSSGVQVNPANGGNVRATSPSRRSCQPEQIARSDGQPDAQQRRGRRGHRRADAMAPATTIKPRSKGSQRERVHVGKDHDEIARAGWPRHWRETRASRARCEAAESPSSRPRRMKSPRQPRAAPWRRIGPGGARRRSS